MRILLNLYLSEKREVYNSTEVKEELALDLIQELDLTKYSGIIAAVAHK